jgi:hypothetical protein
MILNMGNLEAGVRWWKRPEQGWGNDIINSEYEAIYDSKSAGVTQDWWDAAVNRLWAWKAIRSPKPPNTKEAIRSAGNRRLEEIANQYSIIRSATSKEPQIDDVCWEQIAPLFQLAFEIKSSQKRIGSPVFACKMCHFLFPRIFPVMDNLATGVFDYEFYWRGMKDEWHRFPSKVEALAFLKSSIEITTQIHPLYPWATKIIELSHIGYANG